MILEIEHFPSESSHFTSLFPEYCVEEEKGSEKSRKTSPEGGKETSLINSDSQWSFTIPTTNTPRRDRPSITVDFETPVKLVGVVLQGAPQENGELRFVVSIQTEDNGNFDKIVGSSEVSFEYHFKISHSSFSC